MEPREYVAALWRRWVWIAAVGVVGAVVAAVLAAAAPVAYASSTSLYVGVREAEGTADLAAGSRLREELLPNLVWLADSPLVLAPVADAAGVPRLRADALDVAVAEDTAVLEVVATAGTPALAMRVADQAARRLAELADDLYVDGGGRPLLEVTTLVPATEPRSPDSPAPRTAAVLGLLAAGGLAVLLTGLEALVRPRVRDTDELVDAVARAWAPGAAVPPVLGALPTGPSRDGALAWLRAALDRAGAHGRVAVAGPSGTAEDLAAELQREHGGRVFEPAAADGRSADGLLLVVRRGRTDRRQLARALAEARTASAPLLGVVLDRVPSAAPSWRDRVRAALTGDAAVPGALGHGWRRRPGDRPATSTGVVAVLALVALGLAQPLPLATNTGLVAAAVLLPVWAPALPRFRGAVTLAVLTGLGMLCGLALATWSSVDHAFSPREAAEAGVVVGGAVGAVGLLLWARTVLPLWAVALTYGVGQLCAGFLDAPASVNPYKFELALPLTIVVLALVDARRRPVPSLAALGVLGALAIVHDARSAFVFYLVAAALVLWQARPTGSVRVPANRWRSVVGLGGVAVAGYVTVSQLLLAGALGEEVQARTVRQVEQTGSLLLGGRPEWTATWALAQRDPIGFGLGTVPNAADVQAGKEGFAVTNIPTAEGYLEHYVFGGRFELHSIVADLWAHLGPVGLVLGLVMAVLLVRRLGELLARREAGALVCFLVLGALWYLAFGPLPANMPDVALALGLVLASREQAPAGTGTARAGSASAALSPA